MKKLVLITLSIILIQSVQAQNRFPSIGRVGIGTDSARFDLDFNPGGNESNNKRVLFQANSPYPALFLQNDGSGDHFKVKEYFLVKNGGKIGVGTINPTAKLEVNHTGTLGGNFDPNLAFFRLSNGTNSMIFDNNEVYSNSELFFGSSYTHDIRFRNVNSSGREELMVIRSNGKVGVGTLTPTAKLEVIHSGTMGGDFNPDKAFFKLSDGTNSMIFDNNEVYSSEQMIIGSSFNHDIRFRNVSSTDREELMIIKANGFIGIGTTSPDAMLAVNGRVHAEEVKIDLAVPAPDYVFEESYNLISLKEIKNYIENNKHLPEVPSAKVMESQGVELGDMSMILLKKIEEMTLHQIELMEQLEKMQAKQKTLENEISAIQTASN